MSFKKELFDKICEYIGTKWPSEIINIDEFDYDFSGFDREGFSVGLKEVLQKEVGDSHDFAFHWGYNKDLIPVLWVSISYVDSKDLTVNSILISY